MTKIWTVHEIGTMMMMTVIAIKPPVFTSIMYLYNLLLILYIF